MPHPDAFDDPDGSKFNRRMELFDQLRNDALTRDEAEAIARKEGLEPLRNIPSLDYYDPMIEPWWTMPMAMAWIVWRTVDRVRGQSDRYRSNSPYWFYQDGGWRLLDQEPATAMGLSLSEAYDQVLNIERDKTEKTVREAREDFWRRASAGQVSVVAQSLADNRIVEIPPREWPYMDLIEVKGADVLRFQHDPLTPVYGRMLLTSPSVRKVWPALKGNAAARRDAASRCLTWLSDTMRASPADPTMTKASVKAWAKKNFAIGEDRLEAVWIEAIRITGATAWSAAGRRKKIAGK